MIHYHSCPLCFSNNIAHYLRCVDFFLTSENYDLFNCVSCGFVFTQNRPDDNDIGKYYDSPEYASHNSSKGLLNLFYRISRSIMLTIKSCLIKRITGIKSGYLLDIGSGAGNFLAKMKDIGWKVKGIEINEKARVASSSKFGLEVLSPDQLPLLDAGSFDCITFWHVMEHLNDPELYLRNALSLLKPEGFCIVALPNCGSSDAQHYKQYWAAFDVPRHFWHFTPESFSFLSRKIGFPVISVKRLPADVFYISMLSEKYKGSKLYFIMGFLKGLWFSLLSAANKQKTSSLIYIIRKIPTSNQ